MGQRAINYFLTHTCTVQLQVTSLTHFPTSSSTCSTNPILMICSLGICWINTWIARVVSSKTFDLMKRGLYSNFTPLVQKLHSYSQSRIMCAISVYHPIPRGPEAHFEVKLDPAAVKGLGPRNQMYTYSRSKSNCTTLPKSCWKLVGTPWP